MDLAGIDAGGTGSRWVRGDEHGTESARGEGPPIQASQLGVAGAAAALAALLRVACPQGARLAVAGLAGASDQGLRREIAAAAAQLSGIAVLVTGDIETAAASALADGPGLAVWSGTGSFVAVHGTDGRLYRLGGRGWLLGDEGSAFDLVRRAARMAVRAIDGLAPTESQLPGVLCRVFAVPSLVRLPGVLQRTEPAAMAAAAPEVLACAAHGDPLAMRAARESFAGLAALVQAGVRRAGLSGSSLVVRVGGSVFKHNEAARTLFGEALREIGFSPGLALIDKTPGEGALQLARAACRGEQPLAGWVEHGAS